MSKGALIFSLLLLVIGGYIGYVAYFQPETFDDHVRVLRRQKNGLTEETAHKAMTCINTTACEGADPELCLRDWLTRSKCFTPEYVEKHFEKFSSELNESQPKDGAYVQHTVRFNLALNRSSVCERSDCFAYVQVYPDHSQVVAVYGPLRELALPITKDETQEILTKDPTCRPAEDLKLLLTDESFDPTRATRTPSETVLKTGNFVWSSKTDEPNDFPESCGIECTIDPVSGELTTSKGACIIP